MKMSMMIRPAILGITAALTLGTTVKAQDNVSLGPTAGFGHTWLSNSPNSKYQPAGNVGLALVVSTETRFGFGADVKWSIEGDLNYYHGFSDVMKADNLDMKNRNLGLNVGVTFGIGKVRPE